MKKYLELLKKEKFYLEQLKEEEIKIDEIIKIRKEEKEEDQSLMGKLYNQYNQYHLIDNEGFTLSMIASISLFLLAISLIIMITCFNMGTISLKAIIMFLIFNAGQGFLSFLTYKITRLYFGNKRLKHKKEIDDIWEQIRFMQKEISKKCQEIYCLKKKKEEIRQEEKIKKDEITCIASVLLRELETLDDDILDKLPTIYEEQPLSLKRIKET